MENFISYIQFEKRYSTHTVISYKNDIEQFMLFIQQQFEINNTSEVQHQHIRSWIVEMMNNKLSTTSIHRKISSLKSYFKYLERNNAVKINPTENISSPKKKKRLPHFLNKETTQLLAQQEIQDTFNDVRNSLILELFYNTGIRRNELIELTLNNVDTINNTIKVLGKGNKERIIPYVPSLNKEIRNYLRLREQLEVSKQHTFFINEKGNKLYPKLVYNIVKQKLTDITTQEKKSPHVLRHTFATHMLNNGADINSIKELLGHANLSATQIYTHNTIENLVQIFNNSHPKSLK